jgi:hypothetical protein
MLPWIAAIWLTAPVVTQAAEPRVTVVPGGQLLQYCSTGDDLLCLNTFRRGFENDRLIWHHDKSWTVPEGLGGTVEPFFDKRTDKLEYSKVVEP